MIHLSRLNRHDVAINSDLIERVEANPDTTVKLISGETLIVLEEVEEVIRRITAYRRDLLASAGLAAVVGASWRPAPAALPRHGEGASTISEDVDDEGREAGR
jgi:flagellar protein FlbD